MADLFDPEGSGYDMEVAAPLIKKYPLTLSKPDKYKGKYVTQDGAFESWVWHPEINDYKRHQASRNPETGQILKGMKHSTIDLTFKGEEDAGYEIYKGSDNKYYSRLKGTKKADMTDKIGIIKELERRGMGNDPRLQEIKRRIIPSYEPEPITPKTRTFGTALKENLSPMGIAKNTPGIGPIASSGEAIQAIQAKRRLESIPGNYEITESQPSTYSGPTPSMPISTKHTRASDQEIVDRFIQNQTAESSLPATAVDIVSALPGYAIEFAATGGVGAAVREGIVKGGVKYGISKMKGGIARTMAKRMVNAAGWAGAGVVQGTLMPQRTAETFLQNEASQAVGLSEKSSPARNLMRSYVDTVIQAGTERAGADLFKIPGAGKFVSETLNKLPFAGKVMPRIAEAWAKATGNPVSAFMGRLAQKGGFDGVLEEMGEERLATVLSAVVNDQDFGADQKLGREATALERVQEGLTQDFERLPAEFAAFSVVPAGQAGLGYIANRVASKPGQVLPEEPTPTIPLTPDQAKAAVRNSVVNTPVDSVNVDNTQMNIAARQTDRSSGKLAEEYAPKQPMESVNDILSNLKESLKNTPEGQMLSNLQETGAAPEVITEQYTESAFQAAMARKQAMDLAKLKETQAKGTEDESAIQQVQGGQEEAPQVTPAVEQDSTSTIGAESTTAPILNTPVEQTASWKTEIGGRQRRFRQLVVDIRNGKEVSPEDRKEFNLPKDSVAAKRPPYDDIIDENTASEPLQQTGAAKPEAAPNITTDFSSPSSYSGAAPMSPRSLPVSEAPEKPNRIKVSNTEYDIKPLDKASFKNPKYVYDGKHLYYVTGTRGYNATKDKYGDPIDPYKVFTVRKIKPDGTGQTKNEITKDTRYVDLQEAVRIDADVSVAEMGDANRAVGGKRAEDVPAPFKTARQEALQSVREQAAKPVSEHERDPALRVVNREGEKAPAGTTPDKPIDPKKFYIAVKDEDGKPVFKEVKGTPVKIPGFEKVDFFYHKNETNGYWSVTEGKSGQDVGSAKTRKAAYDLALDRLTKLKEGGRITDDLADNIKFNVDKYGLSPRYGGKAAVPVETKAEKPVEVEPKKSAVETTEAGEEIDAEPTPEETLQRAYEDAAGQSLIDFINKVDVDGNKVMWGDEVLHEYRPGYSPTKADLETLHDVLKMQVKRAAAEKADKMGDLFAEKPIEKTIAKEPWQMTQDQYADIINQKKRKEAPDYVEAGEYYRQTYINDNVYEGTRYDEVKSRENPDSKIATYGKTLYDTILKADKWLKEHPEYSNIGKTHETLVKEARDAGKPVPAEVLAEYGLEAAPAKTETTKPKKVGTQEDPKEIQDARKRLNELWSDRGTSWYNRLSSEERSEHEKEFEAVYKKVRVYDAKRDLPKLRKELSALKKPKSDSDDIVGFTYEEDKRRLEINIKGLEDTLKEYNEPVPGVSENTIITSSMKDAAVARQKARAKKQQEATNKEVWNKGALFTDDSPFYVLSPYAPEPRYWGSETGDNRWYAAIAKSKQRNKVTGDKEVIYEWSAQDLNKESEISGTSKTLKEAKTKAEEAVAELRKKAGIVSDKAGKGKHKGTAAVFTPEDLKDAVIILGYYTERGVRTLAAFTEKALEVYGEPIRPHLDAIWKEVKATLKITEPTPEPPAPKAPTEPLAPPTGPTRRTVVPPAEGGTSLQNAATDETRRELGLPPRPEVDPYKDEAVLQRARDILAKDPLATERLLTDLRNRIRPVSVDEYALLLHRMVQLNNERNVLSAQKQAAIRSKNVEDMALINNSIIASMEAYHELADIVAATGTDVARALRFRQRFVDETYTLLNMEYQISAAVGRTLDPDGPEMKRIAKLQAELAKSNAELKAALAADEENKRKLAEVEAQKFLAEERAKKAEESRKAPREVTRKERISETYGRSNKLVTPERYEKVKAELRERLASQLNAGLDPRNLASVIEVGAYHIEAITRLAGRKAIASFEDWSARMKADLGDGVIPFLKDAYEGAYTQVREEERTELIDELQEVYEGESEKKDAEIGRLIKKIAANHIASGMTELNPLIDATLRDISDIIPEMTWEDVLNTFADYGKYRPLDKNALKAEIRDKRRQALQLSKLLALYKKQALKKTGLERGTPSDTERELIKLVNEAKKEFGIETTDPETQLKSALDAVKTRLRNEIYDLEKQITTREKMIRERAPLKYDEEATRLKAIRDGLKATYDQIFADPQADAAKKLAIATANAEKSLAYYTDLLRRKSIEVKPKHVGPTSPELEAIRQRRNMIRREVIRLRNAAKPKKSIEERILERYAKREAEYKRRMAVGDYATKPRKMPFMSQRTILAAAHVEMTKRKFDEWVYEELMKNKPLLDKIGSTVLQTGSILKSMQYGGDVSNIGKQSFFSAFVDFRSYLTSVADTLKAWKDSEYAKVIEAYVETHPLYRAANVFANIQFTTAGIPGKSEFQPSTLNEKIPYLGNLYKRSNAAFNAPLNKLRLGLFETIMKIYVGMGKVSSDFYMAPTAEDVRIMKRLGGWINDLTGRSSVGKSNAMRQAFTFMNIVGGAPRYALSKLKLIGTLYGVTRSVLPGLERVKDANGKEHYEWVGNFDRILLGRAGKALGKFVALQTMVAMAAYLTSPDDNKSIFDPRSSDFFKVRIGKSMRFDLTVGVGAYIRLFTQLALAERVDAAGRVQSADRAFLLKQWINSKEAPVIRLITQLITGKDFVGQPISKTKAIFESLSMLFLNDAYDAFKTNGTWGALAALGAGAFGVGVQSYPETASTSVKKVQDDLAKAAYGKQWTDLSDIQQRDLKVGSSVLKDMELKKKQERQLEPDEYKQDQKEFDAGVRIINSLSPEKQKKLLEYGIKSIKIGRGIGLDGFVLNDTRFKAYENEVIRVLNQSNFGTLTQVGVEKRIDKAREIARGIILRKIRTGQL